MSLYLISGTVSHVSSDARGGPRVYSPPVEISEFFLNAETVEKAIYDAKNIMVSGNSYNLDPRTKWDITATALSERDHGPGCTMSEHTNTD